jgi:hypothetical protein
MTGDIIFEPTSGAGTYYVYYMPYTTQGKWYPKVDYRAPQPTARNSWLQKHGLAEADAASMQDVVAAEVSEIQSINWFNSFYPMEVVASKDEVDSLTNSHASEPYLLFPEKRTNSIRMFEDLPYKWIQEGPSANFYGKANRGEYYVFQVGLYAFKENIEDVDITFSSLNQQVNSAGIAATNFSSFNTGGTNWEGEPFDKTVSVGKGKVQPFWVGVQIPESAQPGTYSGSLIIKPKNMQSRTVDLHLEVMDKVIEDAGDNDIWRLSRLRWLNSEIAMNNEVVKPYIPIERSGNTLKILGRSVALG